MKGGTELLETARLNLETLPDSWCGSKAVDVQGNEAISYGATFEEAQSKIDENIWVLKRSEASGEGYRVTWHRRQN